MNNAEKQQIIDIACEYGIHVAVGSKYFSVLNAYGESAILHSVDELKEWIGVE